MTSCSHGQIPGCLNSATKTTVYIYLCPGGQTGCSYTKQSFILLSISYQLHLQNSALNSFFSSPGWNEPSTIRTISFELYTLFFF